MMSGWKGKETKRRSWAVLHVDILGLIMNRLYYLDQRNFLLECKNWRKVNTDTVKSVDIPWIMAFNRCLFYLYNPLSRRIYTILSARERGILLTRRPLDTKHGWGLFFNSTEDLRENYWRMLTALFLYSPFTDELIDLPDFSHKLGQLSSFSCVKGTFSTPPASSDCMIFLVMSYTDKYCIGICRPGDRKWTEFWFDCSNLIVSDVEYMDGVFYASFPSEAIGAFNIEQKEWKTYPYPSIKDQCGEYNCDFLTESDGKLLLSVYLSQDFWRFLRLDQSQMNWCPIERFDNKALFLGDASMMVPLEEETKELANTVSYFEDEYISPSQLPRMYQCNWGRTILEQVWIRPP